MTSQITKAGIDLPWKTSNAAKVTASQTTREKIVQHAILLFNKEGLQHVTIDDIAAGLKISPGNLTYHFKRKRDLIEAALEELHQKLHLALVRTTTINSAEEAARYLVDLFQTFWNFRFFFNALTFLLTKDAKLRKEYFAFRDWALDTMESNLVKLSGRGYYRPASPPNSYRLIAKNMWSQQLDWLRMQQIINPSAKAPDLYECVLTHWSLNEPHMESGFARDLLRAYQKLLNVSA